MDADSDGKEGNVQARVPPTTVQVRGAAAGGGEAETGDLSPEDAVAEGVHGDLQLDRRAVLLRRVHDGPLGRAGHGVPRVDASA